MKGIELISVGDPSTGMSVSVARRYLKSMNLPDNIARLKAITATWVEKTILETISDTYQNYDRYKAYNPRMPEPKISASYLIGYLEQAGGEGSQWFRTSPYREKAGFVKAALGRLIRQKKLVVSIGVGARGGEARMYEPPGRG